MLRITLKTYRRKGDWLREDDYMGGKSVLIKSFSWKRRCRECMVMISLSVRCFKMIYHTYARLRDRPRHEQNDHTRMDILRTIHKFLLNLVEVSSFKELLAFHFLCHESLSTRNLIIQE